MKIQIVTPPSAAARAGNRVTAERWARLLRELGHEVQISHRVSGSADLLVALHARKSYDAIAGSRANRPERPVVVALTGTDLYQDLPHSREALQALEWAARIVVLQPLAVEALPEPLREKTRAIVQSAEAPPYFPDPDPICFEVCVVGHLREVKDPFRAPQGARLLPESSRIRVTHVGAALSERFAELARAEERENPRYRWLGELPRAETLAVIARSRLLLVTSRSEGGANVVSEALAAGTPVVSSRIAGSVGLLGPGYPGYFIPGDTAALASLLERCETDPAFYAELQRRCADLAPLVRPERERAAWADLLQELFPVTA